MHPHRVPRARDPRSRERAREAQAALARHEHEVLALALDDADLGRALAGDVDQADRAAIRGDLDLVAVEARDDRVDLVGRAGHDRVGVRDAGERAEDRERARRVTQAPTSTPVSDAK